MDTTLDMPNWLSIHPSDEDRMPRFPVTAEQREVERITFEAVFERVIENLEQGLSVSRTLNEDPRCIDKGKFLRWVNRDKDRLAQFEEAKKNGTLVMEDEIIEIADAENSAEDVQRSSLRIEARKFKMKAWNRERYGDKQQIDTTITSIDLISARERAERMRLERMGTTFDNEGNVVNG